MAVLYPDIIQGGCKQYGAKETQKTSVKTKRKKVKIIVQQVLGHHSRQSQVFRVKPVVKIFVLVHMQSVQEIYGQN